MAIIRNLWRSNRKRIIECLSDISYKNLVRLLYLESYKRLPNLHNPKKFSEKINYLAVNQFANDPLVAICADKYRVRGFIADKGYEHILTKLYGVWDNANDINWDVLPQKFVLKCNHGSGYNILCTNKDTFDKVNAVSKLNEWLKQEYWKRSGEYFYKNIEPRIVCEEFIETNDGFPPRDYKFFCNYGEVKFLFVAQERVSDNVKFNFLTPDWQVIPVKDGAHPLYKGTIPKPDNLCEMLKIASDLSKDWGVVRVDFYSENNKIYFGEITFMHHAGHPQFEPSEYDLHFGKMFKLKK